MKYSPPYSITNTMLDYIGSIMEKIGQIRNYNNLNKMPVLRKNMRIHSIHSTLAIEANSLSLKEVKDVINDVLVVGPEQEIIEVKNAYKAYGLIGKINPYEINNLLKVHRILTSMLVEESGVFRSGNEGVFDEAGNCIFIAPSPDLVPDLVKNLFDFIRTKKDIINPLILSSIFHYEFVFIHPFSNGNGRMARLWQNMLLADWKDIFAYVPLESLIKNYQSDYYKTINDCNNAGDCTKFIEFMLKMIDETFTDLIDKISKEVANKNEYVNKLLAVMDYNVPLSAREMMKKLNLKSKQSFRKVYLNPSLDMGIIKMTDPDNPTSKNQKYYKQD